MTITQGDIHPTVIVGRNVRAEMIKRGRTQDSLASCLGLSQAAVSKRLNGRTPWDVNELAKIAGLLGAPMVLLLDGVELEAAS